MREKSELALKLIAGSIGKGFYKAEYIDGQYYLNGIDYDLTGFCQEIEKLKNCLVIEYLHPHEDIAKYCPDTVNCIRYLAGRINGELEMLKGFIRFGTIQSGFIENYNSGGVLCYLNEKGCFQEGNVIVEGRNHMIQQHPDNGAELVGAIPMWESIRKAVKEFGKYFPQLSYLGFDFVITSNKSVKVLEINSLTAWTRYS